jgi:hypothetical protein
VGDFKTPLSSMDGSWKDNYTETQWS